MFLRLRVLLGVSLMLVLFGGVVGAQVYRQGVPVQPPVVLSGGDIGFQMTARDGSTPVGNIVVRVDGKWVPVHYEVGASRLSTR
jgi:hypothetical protein